MYVASHLPWGKHKNAKNTDSNAGHIVFTIHEGSLNRCRRATVRCNNDDNIKKFYHRLKSQRDYPSCVIGYWLLSRVNYYKIKFSDKYTIFLHIYSWNLLFYDYHYLSFLNCDNVFFNVIYCINHIIIKKISLSIILSICLSLIT